MVKRLVVFTFGFVVNGLLIWSHVALRILLELVAATGTKGIPLVYT